eukprot:7883944-Alexandrium_andersonii.AAC.1
MPVRAGLARLNNGLLGHGGAHWGMPRPTSPTRSDWPKGLAIAERAHIASGPCKPSEPVRPPGHRRPQ